MKEILTIKQLLGIMVLCILGGVLIIGLAALDVPESEAQMMNVNSEHRLIVERIGEFRAEVSSYAELGFVIEPLTFRNDYYGGKPRYTVIMTRKPNPRWQGQE